MTDANGLLTFRSDDELLAALRDAAAGRTGPAEFGFLPPGIALGVALGMIDRLRSRLRAMEATVNGRFLGEDAAE